MILRGSHKGKHAKVLRIDKRRDIVEAQIEFLKVVQVSQDDVSCIAE
jgi:ribosomal protein L24